MRIGVLQCGFPPLPLMQRFGDYAAMIEALFGGRHAFTRFDVTRGELPGSVAGCDAYILTGSAAGVYDDLPWIAPAMDLLRAVRGQAKLVGICFGHQLMAAAFGGRVIKAPGGWCIGVHRYTLLNRPAWMDAGLSVTVPASHQDQVVEAPPGAVVIARNAATPYAGLDYGDATSFQFHPEFTAEFGIALIEQRRSRYGALADPAIASYAHPHDGLRVAAWIDRFLTM